MIAVIIVHNVSAKKTDNIYYITTFFGNFSMSPAGIRHPSMLVNINYCQGKPTTPHAEMLCLPVVRLLCLSMGDGLY